jgi:hypothetical protein
MSVHKFKCTTLICKSKQIIFSNVNAYIGHQHPVCMKDPMTKDQESIAANNVYSQLGYLKSLNGTTQNACTPVQLNNINLQIKKKHSTNHSIAFPMTGLIECSKMQPCMDADHQPQVTFFGPRDEWCKVAGKYKYLYGMDTETA